MRMPIHGLFIRPQAGHGKERFFSLFCPKTSSICAKDEFSTMQMAIVQFPT